jgi:hypothetical protein
MRDTIEMAREAGWWLDDEKLKAFAELVRADERTRLHPKKIKAAKDEYCHGDERYYAND